MLTLYYNYLKPEGNKPPSYMLELNNRLGNISVKCKFEDYLGNQLLNKIS